MADLLCLPLQGNIRLEKIVRLEFYCHWTLNSWRGFDCLVEVLNEKPHLQSVEFITSRAVKEDSFVKSIKNGKGRQEIWE